MAALEGVTYVRATPCPQGHVVFYIKSDQCQECRHIYSREYHKKHAAVIRARSAQWKKDNPDKVRACYKRTAKSIIRRSRAFRERNRERLRKRSRQKRKLPEPTRPEPNNCEICDKKPFNRSLCLDHDHETGKFRGWLCYRCNVGLGYLGDNFEGVLRAASYLTR